MRFVAHRTKKVEMQATKPNVHCSLHEFSWMPYLIFRVILEPHAQVGFESFHVLQEALAEHLNQRGHGHERVFLDSSRLARIRGEHLEEGSHDGIGDLWSIFGGNFAQNALKQTKSKQSTVVRLQNGGTETLHFFPREETTFSD